VEWDIDSGMGCVNLLTRKLSIPYSTKNPGEKKTPDRQARSACRIRPHPDNDRDAKI
jgi:hypothetical protein